MSSDTGTAQVTTRLKKGSITPWGIVFMVLATAAPLTAMATAPWSSGSAMGSVHRARS